MRRPLFSTGVPQNPPELASIVAAPDSALSVLDLRELSTDLQSVTHFVTLYALNQTSGSGDVVDIAWRSGDDTPILLATITLEAGQGLNGPVKVLDRFPLRGNAQLLISADVGDTPFVYGYFELEDRSAAKILSRPLQPGALVSPFTYEPGVVVDSDPDPVTIHTLSSTYVDEVTVDLTARGTGSLTGYLVVNDGESTATLEFEAMDDAVRVFDGIPLIGATSSGAAISISPGADSGDTVVAWGTFSRVA